jgi:hypothetical protein
MMHSKIKQKLINQILSPNNNLVDNKHNVVIRYTSVNNPKLYNIKFFNKEKTTHYSLNELSINKLFINTKKIKRHIIIYQNNYHLKPITISHKKYIHSYLNLIPLLDLLFIKNLIIKENNRIKNSILRNTLLLDKLKNE